MPRPYFDSHDIMQLTQRFKELGYEGEELYTATADAIDILEKQRRSQEFLEKGTLGQAWWAVKRGWEGVGELFTSAAASALGGGGRPLGQIYSGATERPFEDVPSGVLPTAPGFTKIAAPIAGSLAQAIPMLGAMAPMVPTIGGPVVSSALKAGTSFEVLSQLEGDKLGRGFATGMAASIAPAFIASRFPKKFGGKILPMMGVGGRRLFIENPATLPKAVRASVLGASAVGGLTVKDLIEGRSLGEQFDIRTPEGQQSITEKAIMGGFTALGTLKQDAKIKRAAKKWKDTAPEFFAKEVMPQSEALERTLQEKTKPIGMDELWDALRKTDDVGLLRTARMLKVPIEKTMLTPQEVQLRQWSRQSSGNKSNVGRLDIALPDRTIFTEGGKSKLIQSIYKMNPGASASVRASIDESRRISKIVFDMINNYQGEVPSGKYAPGQSPFAAEGVLVGKDGKPYLKPVIGDIASKEMRLAAKDLYTRLDVDVKKAFGDVIPNPRLVTEIARLNSLRAVLGIDRANYLYKSIATRMPGKGEWAMKLSNYLTAGEYGEYLKVFRGQAGYTLNQLRMQVAATTGRDNLLRAATVKNWEMPTPEGFRDMITPGTRLQNVGISHFFRQGFARMLGLQDKTGLPTGRLWYHMSELDTQSRGLLDKVTDGMLYAYGGEFPSQAMTAKWQSYRNWYGWKIDPSTSKILKKPNPPLKQVMQDVGWKGTLKDFSARANRSAVRGRQLYNWAFNQSGMTLDKYLKDYGPRLTEYVAGGQMDKNVPFETFLISKGLSKAEAKNFAELAHRLSIPPSKRIPPKGKKPFYEYNREITDEIKAGLRNLTYEGDPLVTMDKFMRRLVRHTVKEPFLPYANEMVNSIRDSTSVHPGAQKRVMKSIQWMMDSWYGIPTSTDQYVQGFHPIARGWEWMRETLPGMKKILPAPTIHNSGEIRTLFDYITSGAYGVTLGYRPMSVLKNMTQSNHTAMIYGYRNWMKGMLRNIRDPAFKKRVDKIIGKVRYQYLDVTPEQQANARRLLNRFTRLGLGPFRMADQMNVRGAVSGWLEAWDDAVKAVQGNYSPAMKEVFLEKLHLRRIKHHRIKRFLKLPGADPHYQKTHIGSQTMGDLIWNDVATKRQGNIERAKLQGAKYFSYLTQYAYGGMESAPMFRGSITRMATMYMSWPLNYSEFLHSLLMNGSGREWLRLAASWGAFGGLAAVAGTKLYQWVGFGPYPTELGLQSPVAGAIGSTYKIANTLGRAYQGWMFGAEDDYYLNNWGSIVPHQFEEYQWLVPGQQPYEMMTGEKMF